MTRTKHRGSCHCGNVRFVTTFDLTKPVGRCNCTVCTKLGVMGSIIKPEAFELVAGEALLGMYEWGGKTSQRYFCKTCGAHPFARGHLDVLGGDYVSINVNCFDDVDPATLTVQYWDGRHDNWMAGARDRPWPV
jgi:hypothetical protein